MANKFEKIEDGLNLKPLSSDPSSPENGDLFCSDGTARSAGIWARIAGAFVKFIATDSADTLTNKTIDADSNTISNIANAQVKAAAAIALDKLASVTASKALVSDASGFVSASATTSTELGHLSGVTSAIQTQINAKATNPMNASGDIIYGGASGVPTRLGKGSDGQILKLASGIPSWAADASTPTVVSKTSAYSITASDTYVLCDSSGGAFTVTLPTAVGASGKKYVIKKTDTSFLSVTIATTSSQTIDGSTSTTLNTQYETLSVVSDGANWVIEERRIPSTWTSATVTGSMSTNTSYSTQWRREGDSMRVRTTMSFTGAPNGVTATVNIPNSASLSIDTAKLSDGGSRDTLGTADLYDDSSAVGIGMIPGRVRYSSTTAVLITTLDDAAATAHNLISVTEASIVTIASGDKIFIEYLVPITNWKS